MTAAHESPTPEVLTECRALALMVAPELSQAPLYVSGMPEHYPQADDSRIAFTNIGAMDFAIRDMLIERGEWQGPGVTVTFCRSLDRESALGIMLHESAHKLPFVAPRSDFDPPASVKVKQLQLVAAQLNGPIGSAPTMPAWYEHHGLDFVRRCLHLHWRVWHIGYEIGLPAMEFAGPLYDLSAPWRYMHALGSEPKRMRKATFAEIEATESPAKFRKLFNADFQAWWTRKQSESTDQPTNEETNDCAA